MCPSLLLHRDLQQYDLQEFLSLNNSLFHAYVTSFLGAQVQNEFSPLPNFVQAEGIYPEGKNFLDEPRRLMNT